MTKLTPEQFEVIRLAAAKYMGSNPDEVTMMISDPDPDTALAELKADVEALKRERDKITGRPAAREGT